MLRVTASAHRLLLRAGVRDLSAARLCLRVQLPSHHAPHTASKRFASSVAGASIPSGGQDDVDTVTALLRDAPALADDASELRESISSYDTSVDTVTALIRDAPELAEFDATIEPLPDYNTISGALSTSDISWYKVPSYFYQHSLEWLHTTTGMPWWGALLTSLVVIRFSLLPLSVLQMKYMSKSLHFQTHMKKLAEVQQLRTATKKREDVEDAFKTMSAFRKANGISIGRPMFYALVQAPVYTVLFFGVKDIVKRYPEWASGGVGIWTDLSVADPTTFGLPAVWAALIFLSLQFSRSVMIPAAPQDVMAQMSKKIFKYAVPIFPAVTFMMASYNPMFNTGIILSVATGTAFIHLQQRFVYSDAFRNAMRLPTHAHSVEFNKKYQQKSDVYWQRLFDQFSPNEHVRKRALAEVDAAKSRVRMRQEKREKRRAASRAATKAKS